MTIITKVANTNTAASTLNVNALGPKPIVRVDGSALKPGDLTVNAIVCLIYDGASFQLVWSSYLTGNIQGILTQNTTIYVNAATGSDSAYDGSSATVVAGTIHGTFQTIQKAVTTAFGYRPSPSYSVRIEIADGNYPESVATPSIPGPSLTVNGNSVTPSNVLINANGLGNAFSVNGPNVVTVQNLKFQTNMVNSAGLAANGAGANLNTQNTVSGPVATWCFLGNGLGGVNVGSHSFAGNTAYPFASYRNGTINFGGGAVFTISGSISVSDFALCVSGGQIEVRATATPTFINPGNVTGPKYFATLNGVINTQGAGVNYFPGTAAGTTAQGGQYA